MRTALSLLILLILLAACWLYTAETRVDPCNGDPLNYMHVAHTWRTGQGLRLSWYTHCKTGAEINHGDMLTIWPPLYPLALAGLGGGLPAARLLATFGLWASLLLGYMLLRRYTMPRLIAIGICAAFVFYISDSEITFQTALSEAIFIPVFLAWFLLLPLVDDDRAMIGAGVLGMMAGMTRYIGMPFAALGVLYILYKRGIVAALAYACIPAAIFAAWLARNYYSTGQFTWHRLPGIYAEVDGIGHMISTLNLWLMLCIACGGVAFGVSRLYKRFGAVDEAEHVKQPRVLPLPVLAITAVIYIALILASGYSTLVNPPSPRLVAPIVFPLTACVWAVGRIVVTRLRP